MKFGRFALMVCLAVSLPLLSYAGTISPQLQGEFNHSSSEKLHKVIIALTEQADIYALDNQLHVEKSTLAERNHQVIVALQEVATRTQPEIISFIDQFELEGQIKNVRTFWLANLIALEGTQKAIESLAELDAIGKIAIDYPIELIEPIENEKPVENYNLITTVEQGLIAIHAPEAWALGYTGAGRVVSNLDTGVDGTHPALADRFRGDVDDDGDVDESWHDPYDTNWPLPQDSGTHGTHTMGTICGRSAAGDTIGVAIDALWIASAPIDRGGGIARTISDALLAFQWIADPDNDPQTQDNPDACGNSWGIPDGYGYPDCDQTFWVAIDNCEAAGTVVIFSAGNESSSGLRSPADRATTYYNCFSVGAVDGHDPSYPIAYFSALGPSECASGDLAIKPEVVAPGVNVLSSVPGGGYSTKSGTSMASPHVTGAVAVIRQANPNLDANTIKDIIMQTADDLPLSSPDGEENTFGHGMLNLYQAVLFAQGFGNVDGYITDASNAQPIPAKVSVVGLQVQTYANQSGYYIFGLPSDTTFTLEASYFGYIPQQQSVYVIGDDTTTVNFSLTPAPNAVLEGTVTSITGDSIANAEITILDTPLPPETTNTSGFYQFPSVPTGSTYWIQVKAIGYSRGSDSIYVQDGITNVLDFSLWPAESFEYSNGGYSATGTWEWGEPSYGPSSAYSGTKLWGTVLAGQYGNNIDDYLYSPQVFLSEPGARLEFYHWYDIENSYDGGNVSVSTDGGTTWTLLTPQGGYPDQDISAFGNLEPGYTGSTDWTLAAFDLSAYYNENVTFRWRFGTDGSVTRAGWYIDDVVIYGATPPEPPDMTYDPSSYSVSTAPGNIEIRNLTLTNNGNGPLHYILSADIYNPITMSFAGSLTGPGMDYVLPDPVGYHPPSQSKDLMREPYYPPVITDQGGPDDYGYSWIDSDESGGPTYSWVDISSVGTPITSIYDDTNVGPFNIGFVFNFYGNSYSSFRFCTNGFISFTSTSAAYSNGIIPTYGSEPLNLIAPFWDDLNFNYGGSAYYYSNNNDSLIISYINVPHYGSGGPYTFQIILLSSGKIIYQYQTLNDPTNSATIGIQNADGSIGLQVAYNAAYAHNGLAIEISAAPIWLTVSPESGSVPPLEIFNASVRFDATDLEIGVFTGNINLVSNDPTQPDVDIPVTFNVGTGGTPDMTLTPTSISDSLSPYIQELYEIMIHNGGDGTLAVTFSESEPWIELSSGPYFVAPNDSAVLEVTLNTNDLAPGNYGGNIAYTSNDPDLPSGNIPVSLTVFSPDLSFSPSSITDSLANGEQTAQQVTFYNDGDGILALEFTTAESWITLSYSPAFIDPHSNDQLEFLIEAGDLLPGTYNGSIDFTSNDPDQLSGYISVEMYIYEPDIDIDPAEIGDTLEIDQQSVKYLHVNNNGAGGLEYQVSYQTFDPALSRLTGVNNPTPADLIADEKFTTYSNNDNGKIDNSITPPNPPVITDQGGPDAFGYWWFDSDEPGGPVYSWVDISSIGTPITNLDDDENSGPYAIGFNVPFYENTFNSFRFCTNGFISFTSTSYSWSNTAIPSGDEPLNLVAPFWDDLYFPGGGSAYYYTNNSDSLIISWINVPHYSSGGPYTFQIIILASGKIVFQYQNIGSPSNSATVGIQNDDGSIGLQVVYDADYIVNGLAVEIRSGSWLSVTPSAGSVNPYGLDSLEVGFDATGLAEGGYLGQITISSNDPSTPIVDVPVNLEVGLQPIPLISLNISSINDTVFAGLTKDIELLVSNIGILDLHYTITDNRAWIEVNPASGTVIPSATDSVTITLDAISLPSGSYSGTITVNSDDPTNPVINIPVQMEVADLVIPDIDITPATIEETVFEGEFVIAEMLITNLGTGTLNYNLSDNREWLTMAPESGNIGEGESPDTVEITLDAAGLTEGNYTGTITIASNDPDEGSIDVPVTLLVVAESDCQYVQGDINSDGNVIGGDITFGVNYFAGGQVPPDSCQRPNGSWLYVAADVNGDCQFIGSDITYFVRYFRGINQLQYCPELPPGNPPASSSKMNKEALENHKQKTGVIIRPIESDRH